MGSVSIKTKETVGNVTYESEYTFSDASDFFAFEADKREQLINVAQSFNNLSGLFGEGFENNDFQSSTEDLDDVESGEKIVDIKVGKKPKPPTKH